MEPDNSLALFLLQLSWPIWILKRVGFLTRGQRIGGIDCNNSGLLHPLIQPAGQGFKESRLCAYLCNPSWEQQDQRRVGKRVYPHLWVPHLWVPFITKQMDQPHQRSLCHPGSLVTWALLQSWGKGTISAVCNVLAACFQEQGCPSRDAGELFQEEGWNSAESEPSTSRLSPSSLPTALFFSPFTFSTKAQLKFLKVDYSASLFLVLALSVYQAFSEFTCPPTHFSASLC